MPVRSIPSTTTPKFNPIETQEMKKDFTLNDVQHLAMAFANLMIQGEYSQARALLTPDAADDWPEEEVAQTWLAMLDGAFDVEVVDETLALDAMEGWPEREYLDVGWVYIPLVTDTLNEALTLIMTTTNDGLRIRYLEMGRPEEV